MVAVARRLLVVLILALLITLLGSGIPAAHGVGGAGSGGGAAVAVAVARGHTSDGFPHALRVSIALVLGNPTVGTLLTADAAAEHASWGAVTCGDRAEFIACTVALS